MKVWLIYPPKYFWPYISSGDNFLIPQSLPYLAAVARAAGHNVRIIDCSPMKIGWKTLAQELSEGKPDVVGIGESHALYVHESLRALRLVKETLPDTITIAGGLHFANLVHETMSNSFIDFIVRMEGERTFVELLSAIEHGGERYKEVRGIVYRENDLVHENEPMPLIDDLDSLPFPAYDLLPMEKYGTSKYLFSPGGATIHHSRGCVGKCSFCAWWLQMANVEIKDDGEYEYKPRWRTRSPEHVVEEIEILAKKYNKRCLVFVDEFWNKDPKWNDAFSERLLASKERVMWFAFMRADAILRDEDLGIFEKQVRSGLCHVAIGVERVENTELNKMGKLFYTADNTRRCFSILREKYPQVFRQGTFIVGVRDETRESMLAQAEFAKELKLDYPGYHPLTPVPGTALWKQAKEEGWIEIDDYSYYDWLTPVISSIYLSRDEIEALTIELSRRSISIGWFLRGIFSKSFYKRNMYIWWLLVTFRQVFAMLKSRVSPFARQGRGLTEMIKPPWYDN